MNKSPHLILIAVSSLFAVVFGSFAPQAEEVVSASIRIDTSRQLSKVNPLIYGQFIEHLGMCIKNGLWTPEDTKHKLVLGGVREDLYDSIKNLHVSMLRWPGGCFADGYHWQDGIGPRENRPVRKNLAWSGGQEETPEGPLENNFFGTDEFLRFCESLGIEPLINVNLGSGTAEEARQWVEYVDGDTNTEYGALRAKNGRAKPYAVKYWGVGNESWGCGNVNGIFKDGHDYAKRYLEFARAMKGADPDIKLLAVGAIPVMNAWNKSVLETAGREMDFLSLHVYFPGTFAFQLWKRKKKWEYYGIMAAGRELDRYLDGFDEQIKEYTPPGSDIRIALDEWNLWWNDQQIVRAEDYEFSSALFTADFIMRLLRRGDRIAFANFAQLVNVLPLIVTDPERGLYVTPSYYPFQLFRNKVRGDILVETDVKSPRFTNREYGAVPPGRGNPCIEAVAFTNNDTSIVDLVVINKHHKDIIGTSIELTGMEKYKRCEVFEINAPSPTSKNSFENPNYLKGITPADCPAVTGSSLNYSFPAHSITLISLSGVEKK